MSSLKTRLGIKAWVGLLFCLVFLLSVPTFAQETTGSIEGTVTDSSGGRLPGAEVKVEGATVTRSVVTDSVGAFQVLQLQPGIYKVSAAMSGFNTGVVEKVDVLLGKIANVNFALKVGDMSEQVVVSAENVARIDPAETTLETNIGTREIDLMPKGTNLTSLLKLSPATRYESRAGGYQVDGASGSENSWVIDGLEVSNFRTGVLNSNNNLPFTFVDEMAVKTSGFNAEYGGATGGVVSIVTKSGTNDFHGSAEYQFEADELFARSRPTLYSYRTGTGASFVQINEYLHPQKDNFLNHFPAFAVGGPMVKDKVWFFTSYAPQRFKTSRNSRYFSSDPRTRTQTAFDNFKQTYKYEYFHTRLDSSPTSNLRLNGAFIWNPVIQQGTLPGIINIGGSIPKATFGNTTYVGPDFTSRQGGRQNSNNVTTSAIWTPSGNQVVSFRFGRSFLNERLNSYMIPGTMRIRCLGFAEPTSGCALGYDNFPSGNSAINFDASRRFNFEGDWSYVTSGFLGRHELKAGFGHAKVSNDVDLGYVQPGYLQLYYGYSINDLTGRDDEDLPNSIGAGRLIRYGTKGSASNLLQSMYFQDRWQPRPGLSFNLGFRMEKEDLPSFNGQAPPINFGWFDKIVPRLGFAWDIGQAGKSKIFASYGRFQDRLRFELPRGSFGGDFYRIDYFNITTDHPDYAYYTKERILGSNQDVLGGKCPITGGSGLTRCQYDYRIASNDPNASIYTGKVDPDLKPFTQEEVTVGFERSMASDYLFSVRYSYKNVLHAIEDAGFPTEEGSEAYIIGNPGEGLHAATAKQFGYAKVGKAARRYDALELRFDRRFSTNYQYNFSYTYSRLYGNYSGLASSDEDGRLSPGVNRYFDLPHVGFTAAGQPDNGRLATDRPHVFKASGALDFDWFGKIKVNKTLFSLFTTAQSGTPMTSYYTLYANGIVLYGRGNLGRSPVYTNTDFFVRQRMKVSERYEVNFEATLSNLFNESNVLTIVSNPGSVDPSIGTLGLNVASEPEALNYILTKGIVKEYDAFLNDPANPQRKNTAFGMANGFQGGRTIRLGVRFEF